MIDIDNKQHVGQGSHLLDAAEAAFEFVLFAAKAKQLLLCQTIHAAFFRHLLERHQALDGSTDRLVIREHAAQPAIAHKWHIRTCRVSSDRIPGRTFGSHEQHLATIGNSRLDERACFAGQRQAHLEIDNMDFIALAEDEGSHLRIPVAGLVTKMHASL